MNDLSHKSDKIEKVFDEKIARLKKLGETNQKLIERLRNSRLVNDKAIGDHEITSTPFSSDQD